MESLVAAISDSDVDDNTVSEDSVATVGSVLEDSRRSVVEGISRLVVLGSTCVKEESGDDIDIDVGGSSSLVVLSIEKADVGARIVDEEELAEDAMTVLSALESVSTAVSETNDESSADITTPLSSAVREVDENSRLEIVTGKVVVSELVVSTMEEISELKNNGVVSAVVPWPSSEAGREESIEVSISLVAPSVPTVGMVVAGISVLEVTTVGRGIESVSASLEGLDSVIARLVSSGTAFSTIVLLVVSRPIWETRRLEDVETGVGSLMRSVLDPITILESELTSDLVLNPLTSVSLAEAVELAGARLDIWVSGNEMVNDGNVGSCIAELEMTLDDVVKIGIV